MSNEKYINNNDLEIFGFNEKSNRSKGLKDQVHEVEKKAISALKHLAKVIVFVIDPTLSCGYSLEVQIVMLKPFQSP